MLFRRTALLTTLVTFGHLLFGNIVSGTESGMGCGPHWPLCQGELFPPLNDSALIIEWTHRLFAALLMGLILATTLVAWRRERDQSLLVGLTTLALGLVIAVALLGALTVWLELPKEISTTHLALGLVIFMLMVAVSVRSQQALQTRYDERSRRVFVWALVTMLALYAQSVLGAYVRHSNAGLVLPVWPFLTFFPDLAVGVIAHQWLHRLMALIVAALISITAWRAWRAGHRFISTASVILVTAQILLGLLTVETRLHPLVAMLHLAGALGLLALFVVLTLRAWPQRERVSVSERMTVGD
ncbi:COX15/CtaA family protein [Candidatus Acetothermia bacterium]|jgi:heme A synthase|nr:COX15/CtaA family protein [Candidatus Acetothermia bacterium]MCI2431475.1 COX15/CtaA family protein [Candidatus Acetothermia bacterium]MCI2436437.1 COX15/CtaA family protein [Candidatus Acetothermia bacterium]